MGASQHAGEPPPAITVVIPTRDRLALLQEAVASVMAQPGPWRLVVVDDASGDGTQGWLAGLAHPRVRVVRLDHRRERSAARNRGLAMVETPAVVFLDDDDRLAPEALERLAAALHRHPAADAAVGAMAVFDGRGHRRRPSFPRWELTRPLWPEVVAGWVAVTGQTAFRTHGLRAVGGFDEAVVVAEDQDLWLRLARAGAGPATFVPQVVLEQRRHPRPPPEPAEAGRAEEVERELRAAFLAGCPPRERSQVARLVRARCQLQAASLAFDNGMFRQAAGRIARAVGTAPELATSPVVGPGLALALAKAVVAGAGPRPVGLGLRWALRRVRGALGRAP